MQRVSPHMTNATDILVCEGFAEDMDSGIRVGDGGLVSMVTGSDRGCRGRKEWECWGVEGRMWRKVQS